MIYINIIISFPLTLYLILFIILLYKLYQSFLSGNKHKNRILVILPINFIVDAITSALPSPLLLSPALLASLTVFMKGLNTAACAYSTAY